MTAYHVERDDRHLCSHCGRGAIWEVVGPGDIAEAVAFGSPDDAEEYADALNAAYENHRPNDDLVAALLECVEALETHGVHNGGEPDPECLECNAALHGRAALAKAEQP